MTIFSRALRCAALALVLLAHPAAAQSWRDDLAAGERALAERKLDDAAALFRKALDGGAEGRSRVSAFHGLAGTLMQQGDYAGAEAAIEAARRFIAKSWGADDLAMARNRQLYAVLLIRARRDFQGARDAYAQAARIRNAKVDAWDDSEGPMGAVRHKPSGVKAPQRAGALVQFRRDINDDDGTDVAIGYRAAGSAGGVSITLYIYRPQGEFGAIFAQEAQAIRAFNPQAVPGKQSPYTVETAAGKIEGRLAKFEYLTNNGPFGTRLYLFPLKRDYVKLRVTFRLTDENFADEQVAALLKAIGWPAQ
ncbi:MAG: hypothetical protein KIT16_12785 [Rhodospirillaceae bacterium]|nr:hypothetical protein [Rhodospirillaceae bacterium]